MTTITATTTVYLNDADASFLGFNRAALNRPGLDGDLGYATSAVEATV